MENVAVIIGTGIFVSLVCAAIGWLVADLIAGLRNSLTELKGHIGQVNETIKRLDENFAEEIKLLSNHLTKIQTIIDHVLGFGRNKDTDHNPVSIIKPTKGKF